MLWSLRWHWHAGALRAWAAVAALGFSIVACVLAGWWLRSAQREESIVEEQLARAARVAPPAPVAAPSPARDFTASLGPPQSAERLVGVIQGAAARAGVTLSSVQIQEQVATPDRLGRTELPLVLQGPYPAIKRCLIEILDRIPQATVARLQWQRLEGSAGTEARLHLMVWSAPAAPAAASAAKP